MKQMIRYVLALLIPLAGYAQSTAGPSPWINPQFLDCSSGQCVPLSGGKVWTYISGTTTPLATCQTNSAPAGTCTTANSNPINLNASGYNDAALGTAGIWLLPRCYTFLVKNSSGSTIWSQDGVCNQEGLLQIAINTNGAGTILFSDTAFYPAKSFGVKLQQLPVSVRDDPYNAAGDGVTDDTIAIQAAMANAESNGGFVYFPCGTYKITGSLMLTSHISLIGQGAACSEISIPADFTSVIIDSGSDHSQIRDLSIALSSSTGTSDGIIVGQIDASSGAGDVVISGVKVSGAKGNGINVLNGSRGLIENSEFNSNGGDGVLISSQNTSADNTDNWRVISVTANLNTGAGFYFNKARRTETLGLYAINNSTYGIYENYPGIIGMGYAAGNTTAQVFVGTSCTGCVNIVSQNTNPLVMTPQYLGGDDAAPVATSCGTGPSVDATSTTLSGRFTEGSGASGCVITFTGTPNRCLVTMESGLAGSYALSANVLTITNSGALSSTALDYICTK